MMPSPTVRRMPRELPALLACAALLLVMAVAAPAFYSATNLGDLALNNVSLLIVAVGMTLVILVGEIDISVASQFAVLSVLAGALAKAGVPMPLVPVVLLVVGAAMGAVNGVLIAGFGLPSIIVTLAMLVVWREGLRWFTEGAWVQNLPSDFQWFGLGTVSARWIIVAVALTLSGAFAWTLRNLTPGRWLFAVGSDAESARLAGIEPRAVTFGVFVVLGALVAIASLLNAVRFNAIPGNAGAGLELEAIAAVVVGGASISGGRASLVGTLLGVALLGAIGPALTFLGINPFWEKAVQGAIIIAALASDAALDRLVRYTHVRSAAATR
jgi:rhamnose transport system permease protein